MKEGLVKKIAQITVFIVAVAMGIMLVLLLATKQAPQCSEVPCPCTEDIRIHSDYGVNDIEFRQDSSQDIGFCEITIDSDKAIITFNGN